MNRDRHGKSFYILAALFAAFVLFLYGPIATIVILSFQGPNGGLTFPMRGFSFHWFHALFQQQMVGDFGGAITRSLILAFMVMVANVVISVAGGMAFRRRFAGSTFLFYLVIASLIVPSILVSLGIGLLFSQLGIDPAWYSSAFGAQLTWTIPFGLLIMFAVFNRFNKSWEEAARDLGAGPWRSFTNVILPIILPGVVGIALFGFSLSYDEYPRTMMTAGDSNTLPLEIFAMTANVTTPVIYALGTLTTAFSALIIIVAMTSMAIIRRRRAAKLG
ncbi:ABC transporter permease [Acidisoma cellulosilytica]|uniref:ABC transporter permease n=1 Tax=Acidisoma cellulosilyticum TaxID=2802395 RepID=A0A964E5C8_9PROT|nr:ABC transporter permease [Acidisoma cellulosilyticum]MCB8881838.1 ABC transporter permease [Acidisoma cellulosilyticum]